MGTNMRQPGFNSALLDHQKLSAALAEEMTAPPSLLPPGVLDSAVGNHKEEFVEVLMNRLKMGLKISEPEIVFAQKATRGLRPVRVLSLGVRTIYRALGRIARGTLSGPDRSNEAYNSFRNAPLADEQVKFVALTDVAACYQYIDHGLLSSEVVNRTGSAAAAMEVAELLAFVEGRRFGLPQNHFPSHGLADFVLDIPERRLLRQGFKVWRYNDDFRLGADTWAEAHDALEELERHLGTLGLTLNDEKTVVRNRAGYEKLLKEPAERWDQLQETMAGELATYDPYGEQVETPEDSEISVAAAVEVLTQWEEDAGKDIRRYGYEAMQDRQVLINAIYTLDLFQSPDGLKFCKAVMNTQPDLTPYVCRYLGKMADESAAEVIEVIDRCIGDDDSYVSDWQALWLLQSIKGNPSGRQVEWARRLIEMDPTGAAAAHAALTLARSHQISERTIAQLFSSVREASHPELVAALAMRVGPEQSATLTAIVNESPENSWIEDDYRIPF